MMVVRRKGQSLLLIPSNYAVIDVETTGYDQRYDNIIEVGCIKYRGNVEVARYSTLIQPPQNYTGDYVDVFTANRTGITNAMLRIAPTFGNVADELWNFLSGELLVGHNVNFDLNFLYDIFIGLNATWVLKNNFVDTLRLARRVLPKLEHHRLEDLDDYFKIGIAHHRAIPDCETTNIVLQELTKIIEEEKISLSPLASERDYFNSGKVDLRTLKSETDNILMDSPLHKKFCVFTGRLEMFTRVEAAQIVVNLGGLCENNVTKKTNYLIVGDFDYSTSIKNGKSNKLKKAEQLITNGQDLKILSERVFYDMLIDSGIDIRG